MKITRLDVAPDMLGESPLWDNELKRLFWIDTAGKRIRALDLASGKENVWNTPLLVGSIALAAPGNLLVGLQDGFYGLNLATSEFHQIAALPNAGPRLRLNDGKMDRTGRYVSGEMGIHVEPIGALHRLTAPNHLEQLVPSGLRISNSICFSPTGDRLYFADSPAQKIMVCDYDRDGISVGEPRVFFDTAPLGSSPDGATVDGDGHLWVALVRAQKMGRISPDAKLVETIDIPVEYPSCPAFGGANMETLFVTSIRDSGTGRMVSAHENAGHIFAIDGLRAQGIPERRFNLGRAG